MYIDDQHKFLNVYNFMYAGFSYNKYLRGVMPEKNNQSVYAKIGWVVEYQIFRQNQ